MKPGRYHSPPSGAEVWNEQQLFALTPSWGCVQAQHQGVETKVTVHMLSIFTPDGVECLAAFNQRDTATGARPVASADGCRELHWTVSTGHRTVATVVQTAALTRMSHARSTNKRKACVD